MSDKDTPKTVEDLLKNYRSHRIGAHSDDWGGDSDKPCFCDLTEELMPAIQSEISKARIDERNQVKDKVLKYFRKELSMFRRELKNAPGLNAGEHQVVTMLLNRIDARYAVIRLMNHDRIAQLKAPHKNERIK